MPDLSFARCDGTVCIRPYRPADAEALAAAVQASLDELRPWLSWAHDGYDRAEARAWLKERRRAWGAEEAYSFAIIRAGTERFLGGVGINRIDPRNGVGEIGYWVRTGETGEGVATTAVRLAARFGFEEGGLHRLDILVAPDNGGSRAVAEKVGGVQEGRLRGRIQRREQRSDAVLYGLLPTDLPAEPLP